MNERVLYEAVPQLASMPRRDLRKDDRFDVVEEFAVEHARAAAPVKPRMISSAHGPIRHLMLWYPPETEQSKPYRAVYRALLRLLPAETRITMVVHPDAAADAEELASKRAGTVELVTTPDWLAFSVWAEDACVVVEDVGSDPPLTYLVESYDFPRAGDQLLADFVAQATSIQSTQLPLIFQGGNVLIGDSFILIGRDYLDDSIQSVQENGQLEAFPYEGSPAEQETFIRDLFRKTFDPEREIHFLESDPAARPENKLVKVDGEVWLDEFDAGWGNRQPIFHIDMFVSLAGRDPQTGRYRAFVGDPGIANEMLGWETQPHDLVAEFDAIAAQLEQLDFDVTRTPLVHVARKDPRPGQLVLPNGKRAAFVARQRWYHATSNNCLVQIDGEHQDVWLPTYGHGPRKALRQIDAEHAEIWQRIGFTVHLLPDFDTFAFNLGALHCIKKYLAR